MGLPGLRDLNKGCHSRNEERLNVIVLFFLNAYSSTFRANVRKRPVEDSLLRFQPTGSCLQHQVSEQKREVRPGRSRRNQIKRRESDALIRIVAALTLSRRSTLASAHHSSREGKHEQSGELVGGVGWRGVRGKWAAIRSRGPIGQSPRLSRRPPLPPLP